MAHFINSLTPEYTLAAREFFRHIVDRIDPRSGLAWSWLADVLVTDYSNRWNEADNADPTPGRRLLVAAKEALGRALALDADLDIANYANGLVHRADGNHHASLMAFSRVIEINQYFARAYAQKGAQLVNLGRPAKAPALVRKAISLSPADPSLGVFYWIIARAYFFSGAYRESIPWLEQATAARPNLWFNWLYLVSAYYWVGNPRAPDALKEFLSDPRYSRYNTIDRIKQDENANPNDEPFVVNGREKFHEALIALGMK